jgi:lysophospholipase L1-like esterase
LGDSIAFGFDPTLFVPSPPPPTPAQFTGYPEIVAQVKHLLQSKKEVNAACPGETSASFLNTAKPDNGCNSATLNGPAFKFSIGLHTSYTEPQMDLAVSQLASNKHINLVTLGIGGNDLLLLEQTCSKPPVPFDVCVSTSLPGVLTDYGSNLTTILARLRSNYAGTLVLVNNYVPNADPTYLAAVAALNAVTAQVGANFGAKIADAFTAFQIASALSPSITPPNIGDPCAAGLLIRLSASTCDVHPSQKGQDLLAAVVLSQSFSANE